MATPFYNNKIRSIIGCGKSDRQTVLVWDTNPHPPRLCFKPATAYEYTVYEFSTHPDTLLSRRSVQNTKSRAGPHPARPCRFEVAPPLAGDHATRSQGHTPRRVRVVATQREGPGSGGAFVCVSTGVLPLLIFLHPPRRPARHPARVSNREVASRGAGKIASRALHSGVAQCFLDNGVPQQ